MAPVVPIAALIGAGDAAYKYLGASGIISAYLRGILTGRVFRAIEYPDGDLYSVKMYGSSIETLKDRIARSQPPPFPTMYLTSKDIKQISLFTPPFFTEPIIADSDLRRINDGSWLIWSSLDYDQEPIPKRGYKLDYIASKPAAAANLQQSSHNPIVVPPPTSTIPSSIVSSLPNLSQASSTSVNIPNSLAQARLKLEATASSYDMYMELGKQIDETIRIIYDIRRHNSFKNRNKEVAGEVDDGALSRLHYEKLIDLALDGDPGLLALARNFKDNGDEFMSLASRLLKRREDEDN